MCKLNGHKNHFSSTNTRCRLPISSPIRQHYTALYIIPSLWRTHFVCVVALLLALGLHARIHLLILALEAHVLYLKLARRLATLPLILLHDLLLRAQLDVVKLIRLALYESLSPHALSAVRHPSQVLLPSVHCVISMLMLN